jgi:peroxiredoxin Q/BCP
VRTTFVIDKESRLVGILDSFKTKTHHDDLLAFLGKMVRDT